ncbi:MAG TPA: LPS assembly lipoprotein LptE, partial [Flavisolibacter sp.]
TVRVNMIENRASYVNPQLSPNLTERLKQKILNQTKLTNTSGSTAHLEITGYITDYSVSTSGVGAGAPGSRQQAQINRLTVTVTIVRLNQLTNTTQEHNVSRSFEFSASQSLQAAESALLDEMVRNLADEIFNRLFSNW